MTTKTILLINSEPTVREVVQACLSYVNGWQVCSTGSYVDGLQKAILQQPDAIVLALSTSGLAHMTFLEQLRANPETRRVPVILMAVDAKWLNFQQFQKFQVAGVIDYIADPDKLSQQIARLLNWETKFLTVCDFSTDCDY